MEAWQGKGCVCGFVAWRGGIKPLAAGSWIFVEEGLQGSIMEVALSQESCPDLGCVLCVCCVQPGWGVGGWRGRLQWSLGPRPSVESGALGD